MSIGALCTERFHVNHHTLQSRAYSADEMLNVVKACLHAAPAEWIFLRELRGEPESLEVPRSVWMPSR